MGGDHLAVNGISLLGELEPFYGEVLGTRGTDLGRSRRKPDSYGRTLRATPGYRSVADAASPLSVSTFHVNNSIAQAVVAHGMGGVSEHQVSLDPQSFGDRRSPWRAPALPLHRRRPVRCCRRQPKTVGHVRPDQSSRLRSFSDLASVSASSRRARTRSLVAERSEPRAELHSKIERPLEQLLIFGEPLHRGQGLLETGDRLAVAPSSSPPCYRLAESRRRPSPTKHPESMVAQTVDLFRDTVGRGASRSLPTMRAWSSRRRSSEGDE